MSTESIGIFDSGFGGLTVMNAITDLLPHENIIYFGDTAHLPYGNKSPETILKYSIESVQFLEKQKIKLLVVACHSACTAALDSLTSLVSFPVVGVSSAGVEELIKQKKTDHFALLGTKATVLSKVYEQMILKKRPAATVVSLACPLFVPLVETGYVKNPLIAKSIIQDHLAPLKGKTLDAVLLACTHYPLLREFIQEEMGPEISLIDPAEACAHQVKKILFEKRLQNTQETLPIHQFYASDDPSQFQIMGQSFCKTPIKSVFSSVEKAL